jgi:hypothetical protein
MPEVRQPQRPQQGPKGLFGDVPATQVKAGESGQKGDRAQFGLQVLVSPEVQFPNIGKSLP